MTTSGSTARASAGCSGTCTLTLAAGRTVLGRATLSGAKVVRIALNATGRGRLAKQHKLKATLTLSQSGARVSHVTVTFTASHNRHG